MQAQCLSIFLGMELKRLRIAHTPTHLHIKQNIVGIAVTRNSSYLAFDYTHFTGEKKKRFPPAHNETSSEETEPGMR